MQADPRAELLNTPQVVGAAIRLLKPNPGVPENEFDVYLAQLVGVIKRRVAYTFRSISDDPYTLRLLLSCVSEKGWNDDWKKAADVVNTAQYKTAFYKKSHTCCATGRAH